VWPESVSLIRSSVIVVAMSVLLGFSPRPG